MLKELFDNGFGIGTEARHPVIYMLMSLTAVPLPPLSFTLSSGSTLCLYTGSVQCIAICIVAGQTLKYPHWKSDSPLWVGNMKTEILTLFAYPLYRDSTLIVPNLSSHPGRNVARLKYWACPSMQLHFVVSCIRGQIWVKNEWMLNRNWCSSFRFCRLICSNLQLCNWEITLMNRLLPVFLTLKFILGWQYKQLLKFTLT